MIVGFLNYFIEINFFVRVKQQKDMLKHVHFVCFLSP